MKFRHMTATYLMDQEEILLLYRRGSRVGEDSWRGIGGHLEGEEFKNPFLGAMRELTEETAIRQEMISHFKLKYIVYRHHLDEVRINYYYFGDIKADDIPNLDCLEGDLAWFTFNEELLDLEMPISAKAMFEFALNHPDKHYDDQIYIGIAGEDKLYTFEQLTH